MRRSITRPCQQCGEPFSTRNVLAGQKFCSLKCFGLSQRGMHFRCKVRKFSINRQCRICGIDFTTRGRGFLCSNACRREHRKAAFDANGAVMKKKYTLQRDCAWCGERFTITSPISVTCSAKCSSARRRSNDTRRSHRGGISYLPRGIQWGHCAACKTEFIKRTSHAVVCSAECRRLHKNQLAKLRGPHRGGPSPYRYARYPKEMHNAYMKERTRQIKIAIEAAKLFGLPVPYFGCTDAGGAHARSLFVRSLEIAGIYQRPKIHFKKETTT